MDTHSYDFVLGYMEYDGRVVPGYLEQMLPLIEIDSQAELARKITRKVADTILAQGSLVDAVRLYNIIGDCERVIAIINKELGHVMFAPRPYTDGSSWTQQLVQVARNIHHLYQDHRRSRASDRVWKTLETLLDLDEALQLNESGQTESAIRKIESLGIVPLEGDIGEISQKSEAYRHLEGPIAQNVAPLLLVVMEMLVACKERDWARRKARAVMAFSGMIRLRLPVDVYVRLGRLDSQLAHSSSN